jgi:hypothetical protein
MKKIILLLFLAGCPQTPKPEAQPNATCAQACAHLAELGCPEAKSLPDGTTCQVFCENTQDAGHALDAGCVLTISKCEELNVRCP